MNHNENALNFPEGASQMDFAHDETALDGENFDFFLDNFYGNNIEQPAVLNSIESSSADHQPFSDTPVSENPYAIPNYSTSISPSISPHSTAYSQTGHDVSISPSGLSQLPSDHTPEVDSFTGYSQREGSGYINKTLDYFPDPSVPLRIIDCHFGIFMIQELKIVLEKALQLHLNVGESHISYLADSLDSTQEVETLTGYQQRDGLNYFNKILNYFSDASVPLRIIDSHFGDFVPPLQAELQEGLRIQQNASQSLILHLVASPEASIFQGELQSNANQSNNLQLAFSPVQAPRPPMNDRARQLTYPRHALQPLDTSLSQTESNSNSIGSLISLRRNRNKRPDNIKDSEARIASLYSPLHSIPKSWGPITHLRKPIFQYTATGELDPSTVLEIQDIWTYISEHPLNTSNTSNAFNDNTNPSTSGLTIWIQTQPADSRNRYGHPDCSKCRFKTCPDPNRTIRKGDFRVAFDESYVPFKGTTDPFHVAFYVHLFCLEKYTDFPSLCRNYNVQPDTRRLLEGKNKMAITRDHPTMLDVVNSFMRNVKPWDQFASGYGNGMRPENWYEQTLCLALTREHLTKQSKRIDDIRKKRAGNSFDVHLNNLDTYIAQREKRNERKEDERKGRRALGEDVRKGVEALNFQERKRKLKDEEGNEEMEEDFDNEESEREISPSPFARNVRQRMS